MQADPQSRKMVGFFDSVGYRLSAHHQACGAEHAVAMGRFHRSIDLSRGAKVVRGNDETAGRNINFHRRPAFLLSLASAREG